MESTSGSSEESEHSRWLQKRRSENVLPKGLPVLVYIYGGGFEIGYSSGIHDYSLTGTIPLRDVVVVTINYRVGPLGFMTTGDDVARGNYGLWDQTLALQWVQNHISSFGGDCDNVTISGNSAGAMSVDLLSLSPHSNKLFHRFYAMSGSAHSTFGFRSKEDQAHVCKVFAKYHGYTGNDSQSLFQWYHSQSVELFKETAEIPRDFSGYLYSVPNFDGDFFPKPMEELRKEAPKIDAMITITEYEGLGTLIGNPTCPDPNDNLNNLKLSIADAYRPEVTENHIQVQKKLLDAYTNNVDLTDEAALARKLVEFLGDYVFNIAILDTAKSCATNGNNTYLASFDYFNTETEVDTTHGTLPFNAATHGTDLPYVFGDGGMTRFTPTEEEFKVMEIMGTYVANFVKYGNPNGKNNTDQWEKYSLQQPNRFFKINFPKSEMADNFQNGRLEVFEEIKKFDIRYQNLY
ncbi:hypothetical protein GCK72_020112 [Caenorhabditis remanei]|uniref:Carboxylic ester hydrolase n=1 Tax=Caenorhabditis remanei TaxID=31234 RepID=A0A6A5GFS7_CAERE|nr:hypothetical protein GCK72_020112 [Caenorhabditis remanei]KAF1753555.1 hypothetical protein GCK72_020112 [Caenorhabditis remanei]